MNLLFNMISSRKKKLNFSMVYFLNAPTSTFSASFSNTHDNFSIERIRI